MNNTKGTLKKEIAQHGVWVMMTLVGTFLMAIGFSVFLAPKDIVAGGFSGLALIVSNIIQDLTALEVPKGIVYIVMNIPLYIIGWKNVGKSFLFLSLIGTFSYSIFIDAVAFDLAVDDELLCSLYGGIFCGIGLGLVVRGNSSTGGTDMLGNILHRANEKITVGMVVLVLDVVVISANVLYTGSILVALYALLAIFIQGLITDFIAEGPRSIKAYYVISEKYEEIASEIISDLVRGVTAIDAQGMFSHKDKKMLLVLVSRRQVNQLNSIVFSIDPNAFVFSTNCKDAIGNGFGKPVKPKKTSDLYKMLSGEKIEKKQEIKRDVEQK